MKKNNKIKCDVKSCEYNNAHKNICNLNTIKISCICNNESCIDSKETICQSFERTSSPITDNEYEVTSEINK